MWFEIHLLLVTLWFFLTWLTWYVFFENEWAVIVTSGNSLLLAIWTKFLCLNHASRFLWNRNTDGCVCTSTKPLCIRILRAVTVLAFRLSQTWALFPSWCLRLMANLFPISWPATLQSIRLSNMFGICIHAYTIHAIYPVDRQSIVCINYKNLEIHGNPEKSNWAWQETAELVWLWVE